MPGHSPPNHVGNDTAIFNEVVSRLSKRGCEVRVMSEEEFAGADIQEDVIVNMCREIRSVERLMALEEEGAHCGEQRLRYRELYPREDDPASDSRRHTLPGFDYSEHQRGCAC